MIPPEKLVFHFHNRRCVVCGIILPEPHKTVKTCSTLCAIILHLLSVLIKAPQHTESPEAAELELHRVLLSIGLKALCISLSRSAHSPLLG